MIRDLERVKICTVGTLERNIAKEETESSSERAKGNHKLAVASFCSVRDA